LRAKERQQSIVPVLHDAAIAPLNSLSRHRMNPGNGGLDDRSAQHGDGRAQFFEFCLERLGHEHFPCCSRHAALLVLLSSC